MARTVRVHSVHPVRPGPRERSRIEVMIDTGLVSGKMATQIMSPAQACELAEQLLVAANIVRRVNTERAEAARGA